MEILKTEILGKIDSSVGSIFTKDDVKKLVEEIFTDIKHNDNKVDFDSIVDQFRKELNYHGGSNFIDIDSAEFSLNRNEIELDSVDIDTDAIVEILEKIIETYNQ